MYKKSWQVFLAIIFIACLNSSGLAYSYGVYQYDKPPKKNCYATGGILTKKKVVALTFDDGPHQEYTEKVIKILDDNKIKATFFIIGMNARTYPDIVRKIYLDGNIVGIHSYTHRDLTELLSSEIEYELVKTGRTIHQIIGKRPILFRPPYGKCSDVSAEIACDFGLKTIMWNAVASDYNFTKTTPEKIANTIVGMVVPGSIIVLHDGGGNREKTVQALPNIIETLKKQGYDFLTIPELLNINRPSNKKIDGYMAEQKDLS